MLQERQMSLNRYEFEILRYIEKRGRGKLSVREASDILCISGSVIRDTTAALEAAGLLDAEGEETVISSKGVEALEPYRVRRAIILAAGYGSRMMPATQDRPKPMVKVNGTRIIDTLLDALTAAGISDIIIVGGYQYDKLSELHEKYPSLQLINNKDYAVTNNISSAILASGQLHDGCYLCEADLFISNPNIITKYQYTSNILGSFSLETDDWCFNMADGMLTDYRKGGTYCYNYYGISYWSPEDCEKLKRDFETVYTEYENGRDYFWEFIPFVLMKENYRVEIRPCRKQDIVEIDNYYELRQLDPGYK